MAEHILVCPRVTEGNIPEFNLILTVCSLLRRQAPLIHDTRYIQKLIGLFQKASVAYHAPQRIHQVRHPGKQMIQRSDILGHCPWSIGACPRLHTDKKVHRYSQSHGNALGSRHPKAHRPPGIPDDARGKPKRIIPRHINTADIFLLAVHPQIHSPLSIFI